MKSTIPHRPTTFNSEPLHDIGPQLLVAALSQHIGPNFLIQDHHPPPKKKCLMQNHILYRPTTVNAQTSYHIGPNF